MGDRSQVWETKRVYVRSVNVMTEPGGRRSEKALSNSSDCGRRHRIFYYVHPQQGWPVRAKPEKSPKSPVLRMGLAWLFGLVGIGCWLEGGLALLAAAAATAATTRNSLMRRTEKGGCTHARAWECQKRCECNCREVVGRRSSVVNKHGTDYSTGVLEKRLCRRRVASAFNREQGGRIRCACHVP